MPEITEQNLADAQVLWDYHQLDHDPKPTDVGIGLGSHDLGVAIHTADLFHEGRFPLIVFTGANAPTTVDRFPRGEAVHYAEEAITRGVPDERILIEPNATNTSENITLTHALLDQRGIHPRVATLITRPYQQRRAHATASKVWPGMEFVTSAQALSLTDYLEQSGDPIKVLNMLVGDTQRIWVYAKQGFAVPQELPPEAEAAYARLLAKGFTLRLI